MLEFYADPTSPYHKKNSIRPPWSCSIAHTLAADTLKQLGYQNVARMDGGIKLWKEQGKPLYSA